MAVEAADELSLFVVMSQHSTTIFFHSELEQTLIEHENGEQGSTWNKRIFSWPKIEQAFQVTPPLDAHSMVCYVNFN